MFKFLLTQEQHNTRQVKTDQHQTQEHLIQHNMARTTQSDIILV